MINLNEWPTDYKMHAGCTWSSDEFAPYMGPATVTLTFEQYALAAKAVRVLAQMEEKELPDSEGWWMLWHRLKGKGPKGYWSAVYVDKLPDTWVKGIWFKIPTPEEVR